MHTVSALDQSTHARVSIDLDAEMAYWQQAHAEGRLGRQGFAD